MTATYSLEEVAAMALPPEWKRPVLWLQRRLRAGEISGYKVGHDWRMTQADVDDLIARHRNPGTPSATAHPAPASILNGLSARAARRVKAAS